MPTIRTKKVTIDGAEFIIAPLTIIQVREFIANTPQLPGDGPAMFMGGPAFEGVYKTICTSLNNAKNKDGGAFLNGEEWTADRCVAELDQKTVDFLQGQIYEFTGLKTTTAEASKTPGEIDAASIK